jgi:TetR/AcrR family transcriptional regulator
MSDDLEASGRILDAAEALFAKQGFTATTIKQIGSAAGLNPALIYYYFGDKEKLYHELLHRTFGRFAATAAERVGAAVPPADAIRALIGWQSEAMLERPSMPKLFVREVLDWEAEHAREEFTQLAAGAFARLCGLIEAGQEAGIFRRDLDARFAAISSISLLPYFHVFRPAAGILLGRGTEGPTREQAEAYGRHAAEFVISALEAKRGSAPPGEGASGDGEGSGTKD